MGFNGFLKTIKITKKKEEKFWRAKKNDRVKR